MRGKTLLNSERDGVADCGSVALQSTGSHLRHALIGESSYNLPGPTYSGATGYGSIQGSISVW